MHDESGDGARQTCLAPGRSPPSRLKTMPDSASHRAISSSTSGLLHWCITFRRYFPDTVFEICIATLVSEAVRVRFHALLGKRRVLHYEKDCSDFYVCLRLLA